MTSMVMSPSGSEKTLRAPSRMVVPPVLIGTFYLGSTAPHSLGPGIAPEDPRAPAPGRPGPTESIFSLSDRNVTAKKRSLDAATLERAKNAHHRSIVG